MGFRLYLMLGVAVVTLMGAAWVGHLVNQHTKDQALIEAAGVQHTADVGAIQHEAQVNASNLAMFNARQEEAKRLSQAAADELAAAKEAQTFAVSAKKEIHRVATPTAAHPGPSTLAALACVREREAGAVACGAHEGGAAAAPARAAGAAKLP